MLTKCFFLALLFAGATLCTISCGGGGGSAPASTDPPKGKAFVQVFFKVPQTNGPYLTYVGEKTLVDTSGTLAEVSPRVTAALLANLQAWLATRPAELAGNWSTDYLFVEGIGSRLIDNSPLRISNYTVDTVQVFNQEVSNSFTEEVGEFGNADAELLRVKRIYLEYILK